MIKTKFISAYNKGKTVLKLPRHRSGVYLIKENDKLVYIGVSLKNLYKTVYRHFETWNHPTQDVTVYNTSGKKKYKFKAVFCSAIQAHTLEKVLINKLKPRDNKHTHTDFVINTYAQKIYDLYTKTPVT